MSTSCQSSYVLEYYEEWFAPKHSYQQGKNCVSNYATDRVIQERGFRRRKRELRGCLSNIIYPLEYLQVAMEYVSAKILP
ncbi:hypothetical protein G9A89_007184 [Geosiphon pyriformis]|nr:hypothetical protein G9A89_007184 [Geosiphon pyriformis]